MSGKWCSFERANCTETRMIAESETKNTVTPAHMRYIKIQENKVQNPVFMNQITKCIICFAVIKNVHKAVSMLEAIKNSVIFDIS